MYRGKRNADEAHIRHDADRRPQHKLDRDSESNVARPANDDGQAAAYRRKRRPKDAQRRRLDNGKDNEAEEKALKTTAASAPHGNFAEYYHIRQDIWQPSHPVPQGDAHLENESYEARVRAIANWLNHHVMLDGVRRSRILRMLDVGCNSGEVTLELAQYIKDEPKFVMGVDVDEELIERAKRNAHRSGYELQTDHYANDSYPITNQQQEQVLGSGQGRKASVRQPWQRIRLDVDKTSEHRQIFKAAFWQCDWVYADTSSSAVKEQDSQGYDLILALSVTKWIHLAHYDDGLRRFFARIASTLRADGGILVLEPQPHKSYKSLHKVTAPDSQQRRNWKAMRVMPDDIPWILTVELGLLGPYVIRDRGEDGFMRALHVYIRPPESALASCCRDRRIALLARPAVDDPLLSQHSDNIPWVPRDRKSCV